MTPREKIIDIIWTFMAGIALLYHQNQIENLEEKVKELKNYQQTDLNYNRSEFDRLYSKIK